MQATAGSAATPARLDSPAITAYVRRLLRPRYRPTWVKSPCYLFSCRVTGRVSMNILVPRFLTKSPVVDLLPRPIQSLTGRLCFSLLSQRCPAVPAEFSSGSNRRSAFWTKGPDRPIRILWLERDWSRKGRGFWDWYYMRPGIMHCSRYGNLRNPNRAQQRFDITPHPGKVRSCYRNGC